MEDAAATVSADDDEIGAHIGGRFHDFFGGCAHAHQSFRARPTFACRLNGAFEGLARRALSEIDRRHRHGHGRQGGRLQNHVVGMHEQERRIEGARQIHGDIDGMRGTLAKVRGDENPAELGHLQRSLSAFDGRQKHGLCLTSPKSGAAGRCGGGVPPNRIRERTGGVVARRLEWQGRHV